MRLHLLCCLLAAAAARAGAQTPAAHDALATMDPSGLGLQLKRQQRRQTGPQVFAGVPLQGGGMLAVQLVDRSAALPPLSGPNVAPSARPSGLAALEVAKGLRADVKNPAAAKRRKRVKSPTKQARVLERHPANWESGR